MNRFLKNIMYFLIPFVIGIVLVFFAPYSKEFAYGYRNNVDCNTSWIYYRLFENKTPVDIAFLGTSHTGCGINDSLIERILVNNYSLNKKVANLAYCTNGRNIQYPLLKDLLATKQPEVILIEVTENENKNSHQDFPYLAELNDVFQPSYNFAFINNSYEAFCARFMFSRKRLNNTLEIKPPANKIKDHSYTPFPFFADIEVLEKRQAYQLKEYNKFKPNFIKEMEMSYPIMYLKKMFDFVDNKKVKVIFLYIPSYGAVLKMPMKYNFYKEFGEVWIPPDTIFTKTENWVDGEHLNADGSSELAEWVSKKIATIK